MYTSTPVMYVLTQLKYIIVSLISSAAHRILKPTRTRATTATEATDHRVQWCERSNLLQRTARQSVCCDETTRSAVTKKLVEPMEINLKTNLVDYLEKQHINRDVLLLETALQDEQSLIALQIIVLQFDPDEIKTCSIDSDVGDCIRPFDCDVAPLPDTQRIRVFMKTLIDCVNETRDAAALELQEILNACDAFRHAFDAVLDFCTEYRAIFNWHAETHFYRLNIAAINIYFNDFAIEEFTQHYSYNLFSLACDIGGTLGLFLGASVLTVVELFDLTLVGCRRRWNARQQNSRKVSAIAVEPRLTEF